MAIILTARNNTRAAFNEVKGHLREVGTLASTAGLGLGALGAGLSAGALVSFAHEAVKSLGEIAETAERIGVSTDALQTLRFNLKQSGADASVAEQALTKFAKAEIAAGDGGGTLGRLLADNHVKLKNQNGEFKSAEALLQDYAGLVANASTQQEKIALTAEVFGKKAGPKMIAALEQITERGLPAMIKPAIRSAS